MLVSWFSLFTPELNRKVDAVIRIKKQPLSAFCYDRYSQNGEDGIIDFLISKIHPAVDADLIVDVGAWDGVYLSNSKNQIDKGWAGLLIEADSIRAKGAQEQYLDNQRVEVVEKFIGLQTPLHEILATRLSQEKFLLLSIDIDGDDLAVFESVGHFRPLIVVIEFNPEIPNHIEFRNPPGKRVGNSARAIINFAETLDYTLAHATSTNLILVKDECFDYSFPKLSLEEALDDTLTIKAIFAGYDGTTHIIGPDRLDYSWHGLSRNFDSLRLPKVIQRFPDELTLTGKIIYRILWFKQYAFVALKRRLSRIFNQQVG